MAESIPPEKSMPRDRLPAAINFIKHHVWTQLDYCITNLRRQDSVYSYVCGKLECFVGYMKV
jgi:hypothetical protein